MPTAASSTFSYDALGNLVSAANASGDTTLTYDSASRLTKISYPDNTWLEYSYDSAGRRTKMEDNTGYTVNYAYNSLGQLSGLSDGSGNAIVSYAYDADGRLSESVKANGTFTVYGYDAAGNVTLVNNESGHGSSSPAVNSSFSYVYNSVGECTKETTSQGTWTYAYDADGELSTAAFASTNPAQVPNQSLQYAYDADGNRTSAVANGVTTTYAFNDRNELTQSSTASGGPVTYAYDADGNLVSQSSGGALQVSYSYNQQDRLVAMQGPGSASSSFQYDPQGNLYSATQNGQTTQYLVNPSGMGNIVAQYANTAGSLALQAHYAYGQGLVSQTSASGAAGYYDFDALGSTAGISGASGGYVNQYAYLPFGESLSSSGTLVNPFQFVGQTGVLTQGNGIDLMRARAYQVSTGRFNSQDPMNLVGSGINLYSYVGNEPIDSSDPSGMSRWLQFGTGVAQVVGGALAAVGGAALIVDTAGLGAAPGYIVATEGLFSIGAGIANIANSFQSKQVEIPGGPAEAIGSAFGDTGKKIGQAADLATGLIGTPLTAAAQAIADLAAAAGAGQPIGKSAAELWTELAEPPAPQPSSTPPPVTTPPTATPPSNSGTTDQSMTFNGNDTVNTNDITQTNSSGTPLGGNLDSYSYNSGTGLLQNITYAIDAANGSYTGNFNVASLVYNGDNTVQSQDFQQYLGGSSFPSFDTLTKYLYDNGAPTSGSQSTFDYSLGQYVGAQSFLYFPDGDLADDKQTSYSNGVATGSTDTSYVYNFNDSLLTAGTVDSNAANVPDGGSGYFYGANGAITETSSSIYDSSGQIMSLSFTGYNNGVAYDLGNSSFSYDGGTITATNATYYNPDGSMDEQVTDSYGANGKITSEALTEFGPGNVPTETWNKSDFSYNQSGETTGYSSTESVDNAAVGTVDAQFNYDASGDYTSYSESAYNSQGTEQWNGSGTFGSSARRTWASRPTPPTARPWRWRTIRPITAAP